MTAIPSNPTSTPSTPSTRTVAPRRSPVWLIASSVLAAVLLVGTTYQVVDVLAHDEHSHRWVVTDPVATLQVDAGGDGSVHVIGAPVDRVTIEARVSDGLRATTFGHRVVDDRLEVDASCPGFGSVWCGVDYVIQVPHDTVVEIANDEGGTRVEDVRGRVEVTSSGSIDVSGLSGLVVLRSENGAVRATGLRSEVVEARSSNGSVRVASEVAPRSVIATSDNGSVEVLVPRTGDSYAVDVSSDNGSTTNEVITDPEAIRRITARSDNGSVRVAHSGS